MFRLSRVPLSLCPSVPLVDRTSLRLLSLCLVSAVSPSPCLSFSRSLLGFPFASLSLGPCTVLSICGGVLLALAVSSYKGTYYKSWSRAQLNNVEYAPMLAVLMLLIKYKAERRGHTRTTGSSPGAGSSTTGSSSSSSSSSSARRAGEGEGGGELTAFEKLSCYGALAR